MSASARPSLRRGLLASALICASLGGAAATSATAAERPPVKPIPQLDVQRYLGEWRQIASLPQWFEALCLSDTVANYSRNDDGTVRVSNRCTGPFNSNIVTRGRARILDTTTNAQLQVTFVALGGGNWFYAGDQPNYIVAGIGADYDWAVVADPDRTSAFVLSRTPTLSTEQREAVLATLRGNGFDPCRLRVSKQRGGAQKVISLCALT